MTTTTLAEIQTRVDATTEGPWEALTDPGDRKTAPAWIVDAHEIEIRLPATYKAGKVAEFIAHARDDIPFLLSLIRDQAATPPELTAIEARLSADEAEYGPGMADQTIRDRHALLKLVREQAGRLDELVAKHGAHIDATYSAECPPCAAGIRVRARERAALTATEGA